MEAEEVKWCYVCCGEGEGSEEWKERRKRDADEGRNKECLGDLRGLVLRSWVSGYGGETRMDSLAMSLE